MAYQYIIYEKNEGVATITLNRPDVLNALLHEMAEEIIEAVEDAGRDDDVRVVIITGKGAGFCSGADVRRVLLSAEGASRRPDPRKHARNMTMADMALRVRGIDKPVIAAVNGVAAGAGFALALGADIRIASDRARFSMIFVMRGIVPDTGSMYLLPRLVGTGTAAELMFTGDIISADEALRMGIVNRVVPHDQLMETVRELAEKIVNRPPITVGLIKRALYKAPDTDLETSINLEVALNQITSQTEDRIEGARAFIEKRQPVFKGR